MRLLHLRKTPKSQLTAEAAVTKKKKLEPTRKKCPTSKDRDATMRQQEGCNHVKIKSHTHQVGNSQNGKTIKPQKLSHKIGSSGPHVRLPVWSLVTEGVPRELGF